MYLSLSSLCRKRHTIVFERIRNVNLLFEKNRLAPLFPPLFAHLKRPIVAVGRVPSCTMSGKSLRVETAPASSRFRWSRKRTALLLLVLQNASVSILTRSSRTVKAGTPIYLPGVAVVVSEIVKGAISLTMLVREKQALERSKDGRGGVGRLVQRAVRELVTRQRTEIFKLAIPAALYAIQNTLLVRRIPSTCSAASFV